MFVWSQVYYKHLREHEGICTLPNGSQYYQQCLNYHLSCEMSPKEVHELGLAQIQRIRRQMKSLAIEEGYENIHDFVTHVKSKPENHFETAVSLNLLSSAVGFYCYLFIYFFSLFSCSSVLTSANTSSKCTLMMLICLVIVENCLQTSFFVL